MKISVSTANNLDDCSSGQLRLVGGSSENEGRVEICYDNQWGTICDNGWSSEDAKVVCRQLGFQTTGEYSYIGLYAHHVSIHAPFLCMHRSSAF